MKKQLAKLALTAALWLALTLLACEDKEKKQTPAETQTAEPAAVAEMQQPSQEAAAEKVIEVVKGSFTDTRDNKTYKTVKIGTQTWMAENLNYDVPGNDTTDVCYDNKPDNCQKYGRLYDGETAKKACPSGWHLPSREEWEALEATAGGDGYKYKLKAKSGWMENDGTDEYGFSALPGGKHGYLDPEACEDGCEPSFWDAGSAGRWWSSTGSGGSSYSWYIGLDFEDRDGGYIYEASLRSVRCIKD